MISEPFKHEAVLERLDWTQKGILPDGRFYEHYYPKKSFEEAAPLVDGINIVYASRHPKKVNGEDLQEVLKNVNGKYAGYADNTFVYNMGSPKLHSIFNIVDQDVETKIRNGDISVSFAFEHDPVPAKGSLTGIKPDHILLYDRSLGIPQGDPGAMIYNTDTETTHYSAGYILEGDTIAEPKEINMDLYNELLDFKKNQEIIVENKETIMKLNQEITSKDGIINGLKTDLEKTGNELKTTTAKLNQDIADITAKYNQEVADLTAKYNQELEVKDSKIKELETKIETDRLESFKSNQDLRWNRLPKGVKDKFESRKEEFFNESSYMKLNQDIVDFMSIGDNSNLPKAEGDTTQKQNQGTNKVPVTKFDPKTGNMTAVA